MLGGRKLAADQAYHRIALRVDLPLPAQRSHSRVEQQDTEHVDDPVEALE
jgi:hypothetical protein